MKPDFTAPVWKRFEKSGLALEALHIKSRELWAKHREWFDETEPLVEKFQALSNSITGVMKQPALNPVQTKERNDIIFEIGDITAAHKEDWQKLITTHPQMFDKIWDAGDLFEETASFLQANYNDEQTCVPYLEKAEKELSRVSAFYDEMHERMRALNSSFERQKSLYRQVTE